MSARALIAAANIEHASAAMTAAKVGAVISFRHEDVAYLASSQAFIYRAMTESRSSEGVVFVIGDEPIVVTMDAYVPYYRSIGVRADGFSDLDRVVRELGIRTSAAISVPEDVPYSLRQRVAQGAGPDRITSDDPLSRARQRKGPHEVAAIRATCEIAEAGMAAALAACEAGTTEYEATAEGEAAMRRRGADAFCFSSIVSSGPELGVMREVSTNRTMRDGDWVLIDLGCTKDGYNAEFARSRPVGAGTKDYWEAYRTVLRSQRSAIRAIRPGITAREVDDVARKIISASKFAAFSYTHITGHGIGTGVWEHPFISPTNTEALAEGMVLAIEPGVFIPDVGGIRIEDMVLVTNDGVEFITRAPILQEDPFAVAPRA
jgi:Xaa-Pro aminopeptidase